MLEQSVTYWLGPNITQIFFIFGTLGLMLFSAVVIFDWLVSR